MTLAFFHPRPAHVFGVGNWLKVVRIDAIAGLAGVVQVNPLGDRAAMLLVQHPMR